MTADHIGALRADPRNARRHTPRNVGMIVSALHEVGAARSIVIDEDDVVLAGNGVLEAAAQAGIERVKIVEADGEEIVAVRRRGLTPAQKARLALFDNRTAELAEWDADVLAALDEEIDLSGLWNDDELAEVLAKLDEPAAGLTDPDAVPEAPKEPVTKRGDLYALGAHRLLCGDATVATDVARLLDGAAPQLIVTDPPYGVEYDAAWRDEAAAAGLISPAARRVAPVSNDDRVDWSEAFSLVPADVIYCWHADRHASSVQQSLEDCGYEIRCQIIWAKQMFAISRGHYHWQHEPCWYAVKKGATAHWIGDRSQSTLWQITWDKNVEGGHSTQKPVECMARPLRNHAGDVYDPFLGSGTTMIAAEMLGRACFGMEIEPAFVDAAIRRWEQFTGQTAVLLADRAKVAG